MLGEIALTKATTVIPCRRYYANNLTNATESFSYFILYDNFAILIHKFLINQEVFKVETITCIFIIFQQFNLHMFSSIYKINLTNKIKAKLCTSFQYLPTFQNLFVLEALKQSTIGRSLPHKNNFLLLIG